MGALYGGVLVHACLHACTCSCMFRVHLFQLQTGIGLFQTSTGLVSHCQRSCWISCWNGYQARYQAGMDIKLTIMLDTMLDIFLAVSQCMYIDAMYMYLPVDTRAVRLSSMADVHVLSLPPSTWLKITRRALLLHRFALARLWFCFGSALVLLWFCFGFALRCFTMVCLHVLGLNSA